MISQEVSRRLRNMSCICTLLIVLYHLPLQVAKQGFVYEFLMFLKCHVGIAAVPAFFAISGFLIGQHIWESGWYKKALRSRFRSLAIPYFCINTLMIPLLVIHHNILKKGDWGLTGGLGFDWYSISRIYGLSYGFHPAVGPFWYIRCLIFFVLLSPLFVLAIGKSLTRAALVWLAAAVLVVCLENSLGAGCQDFFYSFFSLRGLLFFCAGIIIAVHGRQLKGWVMVTSEVLSAVIVCVMSATFGAFNLLSMFCTTWIIWGIASLHWLRFPVWLASSCFFLYAFHEPILRILACFIDKVKFCEYGGLVLIMVFILTVGGLCCIKQLIDRFAPQWVKVALGGR